MKTVDVDCEESGKAGLQEHNTERYVGERGADCPFLVELFYMFQAQSEQYYAMGKYIKNYSSFHIV
jgi:hypothetical protein